MGRANGRDLFDLWVALEAGVDPGRIVEIFRVYVEQGGHVISRALFEEARSSAFMEDIPRLLPPGVSFDLAEALERVQQELIARVPGEPWKGQRV